MSVGEWAIRWTVWLALIGWVAHPIAASWRRDEVRVQRIARRLYTIGWIWFVVHVAVAMHVAYGWSHEAAIAATAADVERVTGTADGRGYWVNYAFLLLWLVDVLWWWRAGLNGYRRRPTWLAGGLFAILAFVTFNATVVFPTGPIRWIGAAVTVALTGLGVRGLIERRSVVA
ncbi:MAG: hypothetical protein AAGE94_22610 [Acidobacteriota bacterium]